MAFTNVENRNFQSPVKFNFTVDRLKDFDFYVQTVNLPDISLPFIESGTTFATLKIPGNKIRFTDLVVSFKVSEGMYNWYEIFSWLQSMGLPENQKQFGDLRTGNLKDLNGTPLNRQTMRDVGDLYGQASLTVNTSHNNPYLIVNFIDIHPVSLSGVVLDSKSTDGDFLTSTVAFAYDYFTVEKIK
jgi:hypothetical protein